MSFLNYSYGFLFFIFHLLFLFISFWFFMSGPLLFSFDLMEYCGEMINLVFLFDWVSFLFLSMVSLITGTVIFYSVFYMGNLSSLRFFFLLLLFVISMFFLIFSGNLIFMMLGWDGLGVTSFALVIYYQNEVSIKSGLVTIFINRLGDAAMVFFICIYFCLSMNYQVLSVESNWNLGVFLFLLGCFTKSAQFPFMSWLPAAMTAPTPISSLVHSSTLVTAGVYLLIRMNILFYLADMFFITKILGLITMGSGGMLALMEPDFKKIVAFSTLSQLGMMVFVVSYGEWQLGFFHLLTHAIFKSFLFMVVGCVMSLGYGNQDSRLMGVGLWSYWIFYIFIGFACLNLSGFPLTMGFLSKDVILELFLLDKGEMFIFSMFVLFCCFTVAYSLKIFFMISGIMKMGNPMVLNVKFGGELLGLLMLFFFMILWGLSLEEMVIFDDMFAGNQDVKIVDFFIILFGFFVWLFMKSYLKSNLSYSLADFFWISWIFMQLGVMYKSLSMFLNHVSFSFLNFSFVQMFLYQFGSGVSLNSYDSKMNVTLSLRNFMISSFIFLNIIYFVFFALLY